MNKIVVAVLMLVPSVLLADTNVDFEIKLIGIEGQIEKYPFEFEVSFLATPDISSFNYYNHQKFSLSEREIDELNERHVLSGKTLNFPVTHTIVEETNPYAGPYPGFESLRHQEHVYKFSLNGKDHKMDEFEVLVRTDAWGASSTSGDLVMDLINAMVKENAISEKRFRIEDDDITYHFSIRRVVNSLTSCPDGSCHAPTR